MRAAEDNGKPPHQNMTASFHRPVATAALLKRQLYIIDPDELWAKVVERYKLRFISEAFAAGANGGKTGGGWGYVIEVKKTQTQAQAEGLNATVQRKVQRDPAFLNSCGSVTLSKEGGRAVKEG
jgi:hypothetical protein